MADTRVLAVLFSDLAASTEHLVRLGDDRGTRLHAEVEQRLAAVVEQLGGTVVKGLGDGLMAVFDSARAALACAVEIQRETARLARREGVADLAACVGVALGEVTRDGDDWRGLTVVEAARLCDAATAEQVLVTDLTLALAREGFDVRSVGALDLKGLPRPVPASEVLWSAAPEADGVPLPAALGADSPVRFVGRNDELTALRGRWKEAAAGRGGLVLVAGEPGIGKTRLVGELARRVRDEGATVLLGRCDEDLGVAYQPFVEALRHLVAHAPPDATPAGLGHLLPELARNATEARDADLTRLELFDAVHATLANAAADAPVLLVLDDVHWAAAPTLALLRHVVREVTATPLLVCATYRDTDVDRTHPFGAMLADLRRDGPLPRVALGGLSIEEVAEYVASAAGHDLDRDGEEFARSLHAETEGNAFFVGEVLRHLAESGALVMEDGRWRAAGRPGNIGLPEGVRDVVGRRLSHLSESANSVLATAAVVGRTFDLALVQAAHDGRPDEVLDALEQGLAANLLHDEAGTVGRYTFAHALVRQTLLEELTSLRRARLHRDVAAAIERRHAHGLDVHLVELAFHALAAVPVGDAERALEHALAACLWIREMGAAEDLLHLAEQALAVADDLDLPASPVMCDLLLGASYSAYGMGDRARNAAHSRRAIEVADALDDRDRWAQAVAAAVGGTGFGLDPTFAALVPEALAAVDPGTRTWASLRAAQFQARGFFATDDRIVADVDAFVAQSVATGDLSLANGAHMSAALAHLSGPDVEAMTDHAAAATALGSHSDSAAYRLFAWVMAGWAAVRRGDLDAMRAHLDTLERGVARNPTPQAEALVHQGRALLGMLTGRLDGVEAEIAAVRAAVPDDPMFAAGSMQQGAWLAVQRGDLGGAQTILRELMPLMPYPRLADAVLGRVDLQEGDAESAARRFATAYADGPDSLPRDWTYPGALASLAELAADLGDADAAAALDGALAPFNGQLILYVCTHVPASAAFLRGRLALARDDREEAVAHLRNALAFEVRIGAHGLAARTRTLLETELQPPLGISD